MALIGYLNTIDDTAAVLLASAFADGFTAENLRIPIGASSVAWQTPAEVTSASLTITAPAAVAWRIACLARTNLSSSATMRVRVGTAATIISSPAYDSGIVSAGVAWGVGQALHIMPAAVSGTVMMIDIADPTNPDRLLNVALCFAGPAVELPISMGTDYGLEAKRDDQETRGGYVFISALAKRRGWELKCDNIRDADIGWLDPLEASAAQGTNILVIPRTTSARAASETVLGLLRSGRRGFIARNGNRRSWSASIIERL